MAPPRLSEAEIEAGLAALPGWRRDGEVIHGAWRFTDFAAAFGFMAEIAIHAEKRDHHPDWSNVYNRVSIVLTTHDSGGLTASDLDLAALVISAVARAGGESIIDSWPAG